MWAFRLMESNTSNRILFPEHIFSLHVYELGKFVELDLGMQASDRLYALQSTIDEYTKRAAVMLPISGRTITISKHQKVSCR